jgi:hypothetical protein
LLTRSQSKTLSDPTEPVLALQGVGWLKRKAISLATITLSIKQYKVDGTEHIDIAQTLTGGIKGTDEQRVLDWMPRAHEDHIFGSVVGRSRWLDDKGAEWDALDAFFKEGWLDERVGPNGEPFVQGHVINEANAWEATQVWGFSLIGATRYYTRRVIVRKTDGSEELKVRLIYDWQGKA